MNSTVFTDLNTERLVLRRLKDSDAPAISLLRSNDAVNQYIDRAKKTDIEGALAFVAKMNGLINEGKTFYWAICFKDNPELIGTLCLFKFSDDRTEAELGYELTPEYQGQGLVSEAVKAAIAFAFEKAGFKVLEACVHQEHVKSIKLLERNNFVIDLNKKEEKYPEYIFYSLNA